MCSCVVTSHWVQCIVETQYTQEGRKEERKEGREGGRKAGNKGEKEERRRKVEWVSSKNQLFFLLFNRAYINN